MRRILAAILAVMALCLAPANAVVIQGLYQAQTIVSGTGEAERQRGFQTGLADILIKLSGNPDVSTPGTIRPLLELATTLITTYSYEDRMKGLPVMDEQGTRDRPHILRMTFDPGSVDQAMQQFGIAKWPSDRPELVLWLGIDDAVRTYVLGTQTPYGYGQREVLQSFSQKRGIPILLPQMDNQDQLAVSYRDLAAAHLGQIVAASSRYKAQGILFGILVFDGEAFWRMQWTLAWQGKQYRWAVENVTFDVALRHGIEVTGKILARVCPCSEDLSATPHDKRFR